MHKMQERKKGNGLPAHQSSWTNAASILVRQKEYYKAYRLAKLKK
jgi:hypothetical protein